MIRRKPAPVHDDNLDSLSPMRWQNCPAPTVKRFNTIFEHGSLLLEIYASASHDPQSPHTRDEIYVVMQAAANSSTATPSQLRPRRFSLRARRSRAPLVNFTDDFATWLYFYGPEAAECRSLRITPTVRE